MWLARSLSGRLLSLTIATVMIAEVFVFVPSVARFRLDYLGERLQMAQIASLALLATPDEMVEATLERELLANAEVRSIVLRRDAARRLVLRSPETVMVKTTYDLRGASILSLIADAAETLFADPGDLVRVMGAPMNAGGETIEITIMQAPIRRAMLDYGLRVLILSLAISIFTATVVFLLVRRLVVRPITAVTDNMARFQDDPEDAARVIAPTSRLIEIARAESALAAMQTDLRGALRQKARLADLGEAVAKISHDLRNMLASAQLFADRIEASDDPAMRRVAPKLLGSLDRAVALCGSTLGHGKAEEAPPAPRRVALRPLIDEVADVLSAGDERDCPRVENRIDAELEVLVDPDHLYRIVENLARNAREAMIAAARPGAITIGARAAGDLVEILVADEGPGLPEQALRHLFAPFRGGVRRGGVGLGLAIARELAVANGGDVSLASTGETGATFRITLPR